MGQAKFVNVNQVYTGKDGNSKSFQQLSVEIDVEGIKVYVPLKVDFVYRDLITGLTKDLPVVDKK